MTAAIGIDAGCTNTKAVAIDGSGRVLTEVEVPRAGYSHAGSAKAALTRLCAAWNEPSPPLGVASPGPAAPDQRSIAWLPGRDSDVPGLDWTTFLAWPAVVPVLNDAHAALVGEAWCGAAAGCDDAVLLTLGTGVGGAIMVGGKLLRGHRGAAGHLGHISLDLDGAPGILHTPGAFENFLGESTVTQRTAGRFTSNRALLDAAQRGDADATVHWQRMVRALATGIVSIINALDPQMVVIGGGVAQAGDALFAPLRDELQRIEWRPAGEGVPVVPARLGKWAGAIGAARYAMQWRTEAAHG